MRDGKRPVPEKPEDQEPDDDEDDQDQDDDQEDEDQGSDDGQDEESGDDTSEDDDEMEAEKEALAEAAAKKNMRKAAAPDQKVEYLEYDMGQFHADLADTIKSIMEPIAADISRVRRVNAGLRKSIDTLQTQLDEIAGQNASLQKALNVEVVDKVQKAVVTSAEAAETEEKSAPAQTEVLEKAVDSASSAREATTLVEKALKLRNDHGVNVPGLTKDLVLDLNKGILHKDAVNALRAGIEKVEKTLAGA